MRLFPILFIPLFSVGFCGDPSHDNSLSPAEPPVLFAKTDVVLTQKGDKINTGNTLPDDLVSYAESLTGTPYKYGSTDPNVGFDCSGFITYVFNHFKIAVPRSSEGFTNIEREIKVKDARRGDIILFTGTDSTIRVVGHMGIVASRTGRDINFIHSTSGKAYGVTTTPFNPYYQGRFVKVLRIFKQNDSL